MNFVTRRSLTDWNDRQYRVDFSHYDSTNQTNYPGFQIRIEAEVYDPESGFIQSANVSVDVRVAAEGAPVIAIHVVHVPGAAEIPLPMGANEEIDRISIQETNKLLIDDHLTDGVAEIIENAIQAIPAIDPMLGCLLKAGVAATVGQIIRCNNAGAAFDGTANARVRMIFGCLRDNFGIIAKRAVVRTMRCWISVGFN